jgi:hypothetical protein
MCLGIHLYPSSVRIRRWVCFLQVLSSPPCILERTPAAGIRSSRGQLVSAYVKLANHALAADFDSSATCDPIEFVFACESRSYAVNPLYLAI